LSRDVHQINATMADFFFDDNGMNILTGDDEGVLRLYEYNPGGKMVSFITLSLNFLIVKFISTRVDKWATPFMP
jgi:hypothetical protein